MNTYEYISIYIDIYRYISISIDTPINIYQYLSIFDDHKKCAKVKKVLSQFFDMHWNQPTEGILQEAAL